MSKQEKILDEDKAYLKEELGLSRGKHVIRKLASCVGEYVSYSILTPIFVLLEVICEVLIPLLMAQMVNAGTAAQNGATEFPLNLDFGAWSVHLMTFDSALNLSLVAGALMVGFAVISMFFGAMGGRFSAIACTGFAKNVRQKEYYKIQQFSFLNLDHFSIPSLVTRLTTDITNIQMAYQTIIRLFARAPLMLIFALAMVISISPSLSLVFAVAIPFFIVGIILGIAILFPKFSKMLRKYDKMNENTEENIRAIRTVKAFVREEHETKKFKEVSSQVQKLQYNAEKILVAAMPVLSFIIYGCMIGIVWFGGGFVMDGKMSLGDFSAFLSYLMNILMSATMIALGLFMIVIARASAGRVCEVFDEEIDIVDKEDALDVEVKDGSVTFENVSFSYSKNPDKLNLENINIDIKAGQTVGILGGTGSSKTTLVQLIPRLYDVYDGSVKIGGVDVRDYKLSRIRDSVAMVLQNNTLFSGTIEENLKWGNEEATREQIDRAAKAAQAYDFIMGFEKGYDTDLGQGGVNVSGGQKQRLCIARALLKEPKIMILDDSTSAVDTATDAKIRAAFKQEFTNTTVFIIAQRISSIQDADVILVMDNGKIIAQGNHKELMKSCDIYKDICDEQNKGVTK